MSQRYYSWKSVPKNNEMCKHTCVCSPTQTSLNTRRTSSSCWWRRLKGAWCTRNLRVLTLCTSNWTWGQRKRGLLLCFRMSAVFMPMITNKQYGVHHAADLHIVSTHTWKGARMEIRGWWRKGRGDSFIFHILLRKRIDVLSSTIKKVLWWRTLATLCIWGQVVTNGRIMCSSLHKSIRPSKSLRRCTPSALCSSCSTTHLHTLHLGQMPFVHLKWIKAMGANRESRRTQWFL